MTDLEKKIKKLKSLKQFSNFSDEEITILAQEKLKEEELLKSISYLQNKDEKDFALNLLREYNKYNFESPAEKDTLNQLIYIQIAIERVKKQLNLEAEKGANPIKMLEELRALNDESLKLKEALRMDKEKEQSDFLELWNNLKKRALAYYEEHKGCNIIKCPKCQYIYPLLLRTDDKIPVKSVWFKGTDLYNEEVMKLYNEKRITKEETAKILGCSEYYVDIAYELFLNENKNDKKD